MTDHQSRLAELIGLATIHRNALDELLEEACEITGESPYNSFTAEAIWDGKMSAKELLASVKAGRYVRIRLPLLPARSDRKGR